MNIYVKLLCLPESEQFINAIARAFFENVVPLAFMCRRVWIIHNRRLTFLTVGNYREQPHSCFKLVSNFATKASSFFEMNLPWPELDNCRLLDKSI